MYVFPVRAQVSLVVLMISHPTNTPTVRHTSTPLYVAATTDMSARAPSRRSIPPLVVSFPSVLASSFLSLGCGKGATPGAVSISVAELVKEPDHALEVLALKFHQQQHGLLSMQDACQAISLLHQELEEVAPELVILSTTCL